MSQLFKCKTKQGKIKKTCDAELWKKISRGLPASSPNRNRTAGLKSATEISEVNFTTNDASLSP